MIGAVTKSDHIIRKKFRELLRSNVVFYHHKTHHLIAAIHGIFCELYDRS